MNCLQPLTLEVKDKYNRKEHIFVPCGRCPLCIQNRSNQWVFRLKEQMKKCSDAYFITLTYDNEHLPHNSNGKEYVQKFIKRLRKNYHLPKEFKYYLVSELGGEFGRLHYHALFYNTGMRLGQLWRAIYNTWASGRIKVDYINNNRINYCAKYMLQNLYRPEPSVTKEVHTYRFGNSVVTREVIIKEKVINYFFMICSKGIGECFVTPRIREHYRDTDELVYHENGYKKAIPSYYIKKIYDEDSPEYVKVKRKRLDKCIDDYHAELQAEIQHVRYCDENSIPLGRRPKREEVLQREEKARQIVKKSKKYKFTKPPTDD